MNIFQNALKTMHKVDHLSSRFYNNVTSNYVYRTYNGHHYFFLPAIEGKRMNKKLNKLDKKITVCKNFSIFICFLFFF